MENLKNSFELRVKFTFMFKINVKLPRSLCLVVLVAQNGKLKRFKEVFAMLSTVHLIMYNRTRVEFVQASVLLPRSFQENVCDLQKAICIYCHFLLSEF